MAKTTKGKSRVRLYRSPAAREARRAWWDEQERRELAVKEKNAASIETFSKAFTVYAEAIAKGMSK